ncbi:MULTISPECIES: YjcZ family sporulation protein [Bacillaceae]|nr:MULTISPECIES: YjcZ family sporulation protein [Bacillaceae]
MSSENCAGYGSGFALVVVLSFF